MGSRKKTNTQKARWFSLRRLPLLGILALIVGVIGLYFALRANEIAFQQYKSDVVVLNEWNAGYDFDSTIAAPVVMLGCVERVRFSNLGNAPDSMIGYDTTVYYQNTTSTFNSISGMATNRYSLSSPPSSRMSYTASDKLLSAMDRLEIKIAPALAFGNQRSSITGMVSAVAFPYSINGFSTFDLEMSIVFGVVPGSAFNLFYEKGEPIFISQPANLAPLDFEINFRFASGAVAKTSRISCGAIGVQEHVANPPTPLPTSKTFLSSVVMNPASPSRMKFDQKVDITFNYTTDEVNGVRIWAFPHFAERNLPNEFSTNPSPVYPVGHGEASAFITVSSGETTVDQIILQIWNADKTMLLYESRMPVNYQFGE